MFEPACRPGCGFQGDLLCLGKPTMASTYGVLVPLPSLRSTTISSALSQSFRGSHNGRIKAAVYLRPELATTGVFYKRSLTTHSLALPAALVMPETKINRRIYNTGRSSVMCLVWPASCSKYILPLAVVLQPEKSDSPAPAKEKTATPLILVDRFSIILADGFWHQYTSHPKVANARHASHTRHHLTRRK